MVGFRPDSCILYQAGGLYGLLGLILDVPSEVAASESSNAEGALHLLPNSAQHRGPEEVEVWIPPAVSLPDMLPPVPVRAPAWDAHPWQVSSHPIKSNNYKVSCPMLSH